MYNIYAKIINILEIRKLYESARLAVRISLVILYEPPNFVIGLSYLVGYNVEPSIGDRTR